MVDNENHYGETNLQGLGDLQVIYGKKIDVINTNNNYIDVQLTIDVEIEYKYM